MSRVQWWLESIGEVPARRWGPFRNENEAAGKADELNLRLGRHARVIHTRGTL